MHMPGLSGLATLKRLKSNVHWQRIPVIMLSSSDAEEGVVSALELGADDYVVKPYIGKVLFARMRTALRLREKTKILEDLAKTDFLTCINNRACFDEQTSSAISQAQRTEQPLVIAMLDIDFFKLVNDDYGHDVGDKILIAFAKRLTECFRNYDIVARIGGEEFAVCLPHTSIDDAINACERFRTSIEYMRIPLNNGSKNEVGITVSIGLSSSTCVSLDMACLLKQADIGLYHAKSHGRNQVVNADELLDNDIVTLGDTSEYTAEEKQFIQEKENFNLNETGIVFQIEGIDVKLGMSNVLDDEKLYKEILKIFYQDHHHDANKLATAIKCNDVQASKYLAHTLKGVACSVGAMPLFEAAKLLDAAINEQQNDSLTPLLQRVVAELEVVMCDINEELIVSAA
jgi:diguanylate cyclase (GGDEF)-like protein